MSSEVRTKSFADLFHNEVTAWLVLALSLVITALGWVLSTQIIEKRALDLFTVEVRDAQERIQSRINQYEQVLRGGAAFFDAYPDVTRQQWQQYVESLNLQRDLPGVQGLAFANRVEASQLAAYEKAVRAEGFPEFKVNPEGPRDVYFPITFIEPFDVRNQRAFGFDMFAEPVRREAMRRAMDTGLPTVSGLVYLKQEEANNPRPGFLIYLPVYEPGQNLASVDDRRQAIRGFVYSPFRAPDLMQNVLGSEKTPLHFQLYDSQSAFPNTLLFDSTVGVSDGRLFDPTGHSHEMTVPIELNGRTWTARFQSTPEFNKSVHSQLPSLILMAGGLIDLLLFLTLYSLGAQRKRESASEAKSYFLANMSHEIRTPLNAIVGLNNLLRDKVQDVQGRMYVAQVKDASEQLLGMVEDILSFSQIESGAVKVESVEFNLHELAGKHLRMLMPQAQDKGLELELEIDPMTPVMVKGDPLRYGQVLSNLLSNAIKFSDSGTVRVRLLVDQISNVHAQVRTEVHDQGIGIDVRDFRRLTRPFEQADNSATRRFGGTGLGLAICKRLAELMDGELFVSSVPNVGSVFGFTVPLAVVYKPVREVLEQEPSSTTALDGKNILVVEDNLLNQHVIKALLLRMHARVQVVENGQMALDTVVADPSIDLVLMDVHMPVMNGLEATREIRKLPGQAGRVPIVALTAGALPEDEQACRAAGMNDFLTKPVDVPKLQRVLSRCLSLSR